MITSIAQNRLQSYGQIVKGLSNVQNMETFPHFPVVIRKKTLGKCKSHLFLQAILVNVMKKLWKNLDLLLLFVRYSFIMDMKIWQMGGVSMGEVITVLSGKGGTGKTSVCAALACALAEEDQRVLCIDCDVGLRNLDISLGMSDLGALFFLDVSEGGYGLDRAAEHPLYPNLKFLTAPMNRPVENIDPIAFGDMLQEARKFFDYIFLDAPAGVDVGFRLVAQAADRFLLVTGSGPAAMRDAARVGDILDIMGKHQVRLVVNRVQREMLKTVKMTIDDVMDNTGLPLLGVVPEDLHVTLAAAVGQPLLKYKPRCAAAKACRRIANRLQGLPEPIGFR